MEETDKSPEETPKKEESGANEPQAPIVTASGKKRPPYKYDPEKITLRFIFANRDGLTVTIECRPGDTVGEVKGALLSVWPDDLPSCSGGDKIRLVCMGKGILMPDSRSLEDCQVPVFKTHPTPINVSVKPEPSPSDMDPKKKGGSSRSAGASSHHASGGGMGGGSGGVRAREGNGNTVSQGCSCTIL